MKVILNQHIKDSTIQEQWAHVHGSNNRPHRIKSYSNVSQSSLKRISQNAVSATVLRYDGEEGEGYILQTTYKM